MSSSVVGSYFDHYVTNIGVCSGT